MNQAHRIVLAVVIASSSTMAVGDTTIVYTGPEASTSTLYIKDGRVRMNPPNQKGSYSVFDSRSDTVTHVSAEQQAYVVVGERAMRARAEQMRQAMQQMQQQMQNMPEQQRGGPSEPPPEPSLRKTGSTETIANIRCEVYETYQGDQKVGEICVAKDVGLSAKDREAMNAMKAHTRKMAELMSSVMGDMPGGGGSAAMDPSDKIGGVPIRVSAVDPRSGELTTMMELVAVKTGTLSPELFKVPAGYKRMEPGQQHR
jgi:hypothetical protein